jgi:hypothetical protein
MENGGIRNTFAIADKVGSRLKFERANRPARNPLANLHVNFEAMLIHCGQKRCPLYPQKRTFIRSPRRRGQAVWGDFEAKGFGSLEVNDKLDFGRKFDRQVAGFGAL